VTEEANILSPLDGFVVRGRHGRPADVPGVIVSEVRAPGLAMVAARRGRREALAEAARAHFGAELLNMPRRVEGRAIAFVWCGPEQWLAYSHPAPAEGIEKMLTRAFLGLASITDQSHGRVVLRVTGSRVRDALAKGVPIDLNPSAFHVGSAAATAAFHIGAHIWQIDDKPTYELAVARSYALSLWLWLQTSAAEYGVQFC
jgi:methylglutamate dehydrogenase subunit D